MTKTSFEIPIDLSVDVWLTGDGKVNVCVMSDGCNPIAKIHLTYEELYQSCGFSEGILEPEVEADRTQVKKQIVQQMKRFADRKLGL